MPINAADLLKRLKLLDTSPDAPQNPSQLKLKVPDFKVANSDLSSRITRGSEGTPYPTAGGVNLPSSEGPSLEIPSGLPESPGRGGSLTAASENRAPFKFGVPETGALGNVLARQDANSMGLPSSAVRNGAIEPPKMHHGFWDRLKSVGEGALMGMGQIAEQNARSGREQTLESLLGGGAAGGLAGGVSPLSIDALRNQKQADRDMGTLQQQQDLEKGQAQIDDLRRRAKLEDPAKERERDDVRGAWQAILSSGQDFSADDPEHKAIHDRAAALGITLPYGKKVTKPAAPNAGDRTVGTQVIRPNADGSYTPVYTAPDKPEETPQQRAERNAKRESALADVENFKVLEAKHQSNINGLNTNLGQLNQQLANLPRAKDGRAEDLVQYEYLTNKIKGIEGQIEKATNDRNSAAEKKSQAQADALKYDFGGSKPPSASLNPTEQKIYDAAKGKGLDPDKAVEMYRSGKY